MFELLKEPSGVIALDDETLFVIEDESQRALRRLQIQRDANSLHFEEFAQTLGETVFERLKLHPLDDLEGIARLSDTRFFVIGSHENASRSKQPEREKLVLFTRDNDMLRDVKVRRDLYDRLSATYPELAGKFDKRKNRNLNQLNIEALAYDRKRDQLLVGLRTPLLGNKAVIVRILNPERYLDGAKVRFSPDLQLIDLNKGGIRAMAYDDLTDKLLIVSKRETGKKQRSLLWTLAADGSDTPNRIKHFRKKQFDDVEGLTPLGNQILFVRDYSNDRSKHGDHWFTFERSSIFSDP